MRETLLPSERPYVHRQSSIDQFKGYISVYKKGGWAPLVFDQLDGIICGEVKTHPVILSWGDDIGYIFPEGHCSYASDKFIIMDKYGVEEKVLPPCFGKGGEFYQEFVNANAFINFNPRNSLGVHNVKHLRTGLSMVLAEDTLPAKD